MDDGEVDLSRQLLLPNPEFAESFDELLRNTTTCTHTHTCNPPGPAAASHTHTCYHTHRQVLAAGEGERRRGEGQRRSQRPLGNREAVRKYREKKKAHAAYLEEEVKKLRLANQQLLRRLQGQAALEAEVVRLRSLITGIRAKIDAELASLRCDVNCGNPEVVLSWGGNCVPAIRDCLINQNGDARQSLEMADVVGSLVSSASPSL